MAKENNKTFKLLMSYFSYDKINGQLVWKKPTYHNKIHLVGKPAGSLAGHNGRIKITLFGKLWFLHRIIWRIEKGHWPKGIIDHIDGNSGNNKISNLRDTTYRENSANAKSHRNGHLAGTSLQKGRWKSKIYFNKKNIYLGNFKTQIEAHNAYKQF